MNRFFVYLVFSCLISSFLFSACTDNTTTKTVNTSDKKKTSTQTKSTVKLDTDKDKASYGVGVSIGRRVSSTPYLEFLDVDIIMEGIRDIVSNSKVLITDTEYLAAMNSYTEQVKAEIKVNNIQASADFFAQNKNRKGITTLSNGLQYEVLQKGEGAKPTSEDKVLMHNITKNLEGETLYSTYDKNPQVLYLNKTIPAFQQALLMMSPKSRYRIYVPYDLAYGEKGYHQIEPYEAVIFELELLSIN